MGNGSSVACRTGDGLAGRPRQLGFHEAKSRERRLNECFLGREAVAGRPSSNVGLDGEDVGIAVAGRSYWNLGPKDEEVDTAVAGRR